MPPTMGVLRATDSEPLRSIIGNDAAQNAAEESADAGKEATKPALRMDMPRACTR